MCRANFWHRQEQLCELIHAPRLGEDNDKPDVYLWDPKTAFKIKLTCPNHPKVILRNTLHWATGFTKTGNRMSCEEAAMFCKILGRAPHISRITQPF